MSTNTLCFAKPMVCLVYQCVQQWQGEGSQEECECDFFQSMYIGHNLQGLGSRVQEGDFCIRSGTALCWARLAPQWTK